MRSTNPSESSSRPPSALNEPPAEADTMLMGFEFFDQSGRLNPRKILFTEKTCPNKTQRVLSHLFGRIMKWNACRWAENFLKNAQMNQAVLPGRTTQEATRMLQDIRATGVVNMPKLFSFVASAANAPKASDQNDQPMTRPRTGNPIGTSSPPFLINHDEIIQTFQFQDSETDHNEVFAPETIADHKAVDNTPLFEACQIIEMKWNELSIIGDGRLVPPQFKLPVKSGFLDYCQQRSVRQSDEQAIEQSIWRTQFASMDEKEWSKYQNLMTVPQYQAWTRKRHEWIALISKRVQLPSEKQAPERDLRTELKTKQPVVEVDPEPTVAQAFSGFSSDFKTASHGRGLLPLPVQEILDSGFITYCDVGIAAFEHIDTDALEEFLNKYQNKWDIFKKILTPSQFAQLIKHRDQVAQDIAVFRATHPSIVRVSTEDIRAENDPQQTDIQDIQQNNGHVAGLFAAIAVISLEDLNQIEWNAIDLHRKISLDDAKKLHDYFSSAEINPANLEISKKIEKLSRKMKESKASETQALGDSIESSMQADLQEPGDILAGIYGSYLKRYASENREKNTTAGIKKTRVSAKKKTEKHTKSRKKTRTQKSAEKQIVSETKTVAQEARDQIKEAYEVLKRLNENT